MPEPHTLAGLGGTFDHFHVGHQHFLEFAARQADELWVGITSDDMTHAKHWASSIQPFAVRKKAVEEFLTKRALPFKTFVLENAFGPTLENSPVTCLVVTEHSVSGGENILRQRENMGLPVLPMHICTLLRDHDGKTISSTRIRSGEINREGQVIASVMKNAAITPATRAWLQTPQGKMLGNSTHPKEKHTSPIIVVGDVVLDTFLTKSWHVDVGFFDGHSKRKPFLREWQTQASANITEPAGIVSAQGISWLRTFFDAWLGPAASPTLVQVTGEEDLLAVSAILTAPLGSRIYYGQPDEGIVEVELTEPFKNEFAKKFLQLQKLAE